MLNHDVRLAENNYAEVSMINLRHHTSTVAPIRDDNAAIRATHLLLYRVPAQKRAGRSSDRLCKLSSQQEQRRQTQLPYPEARLPIACRPL
jgi:hypothetical protein